MKNGQNVVKLHKTSQDNHITYLEENELKSGMFVGTDSDNSIVWAYWGIDSVIQKAGMLCYLLKQLFEDGEG